MCEDGATFAAGAIRQRARGRWSPAPRKVSAAARGACTKSKAQAVRSGWRDR